MKKLFMALMMAAAVFFTNNIAFANYPMHLNGDSNLVLMYGHMGTGEYLDKASVNIESQSGDECTLRADIYFARSAIDDEIDFCNGGEGKITSVLTLSFRYDRKNIKMYIYNNDKDVWTYLEPQMSGVSACALSSGEMSYYLTFGERFYGAYEVGDGQRPLFSDSFYDKANI